MHLLANEVFFLSILLGPVFPIVTDWLFRGAERRLVNFRALALVMLILQHYTFRFTSAFGLVEFSDLSPSLPRARAISCYRFSAWSWENKPVQPGGLPSPGMVSGCDFRVPQESTICLPFPAGKGGSSANIYSSTLFQLFSPKEALVSETVLSNFRTSNGII